MSVTYTVENALSRLASEPAESAQFIHLDDAWARPHRCGGRNDSIVYPTHPFNEAEAETVENEEGVATDLTVVDMIEASLEVLTPGGILVADTDSYLLPKVTKYCAEADHLGYATATVTELTKAGDPDRSTPGMYGASGGYTSCLIWKQAIPAPVTHPLRDHHNLHCPVQRQREDWGWATVKPLDPYLKWIRTYTEEGDRVIVPCAGTAPAAIAAERVYGESTDVLCIDTEPEARDAYRRRRDDELDYQSGLSNFA